MSPSIQQIVAYWQPRISELHMGCDWSDAEEHCWRCGDKTTLEKCHIIAKACKGSNTPGNFVLLCRRCHLEAPDCTHSKKPMWLWIKHTRNTFGGYWRLRKITEALRIIGYKPGQKINIEKLGEALSTATVMVDGFTIGTLAWALKLSIEE